MFVPVKVRDYDNILKKNSPAPELEDNWRIRMSSEAKKKSMSLRLTKALELLRVLRERQILHLHQHRKRRQILPNEEEVTIKDRTATAGVLTEQQQAVIDQAVVFLLHLVLTQARSH